MKEEDFIKAIRFTEQQDPKTGITHIRATVCFQADHLLSDGFYGMKSAKQEVRNHLVEALLRHVYEDRRKEFYEAIEALHYEVPYGGSLVKATEKILSIAKRQ